MSSKWLTQLHEAAEVADNNHLSELIEQIPADRSELADIIADLMNNFRVDKITDLAEQALSKQES